jgi:hypothetical protein
MRVQAQILPAEQAVPQRWPASKKSGLKT